jgi:hypothetical protein
VGVKLEEPEEGQPETVRLAEAVEVAKPSGWSAEMATTFSLALVLSLLWLRGPGNCLKT